jgi:insertion element IS1 protein InsB
VLGGRDDVTCQKLLDKVGLKGKTFLADDWEGFHRLIPQDQLFTGKDLTFSIEQDNSNIRHFLARFRRRTKVVSKAVEMVRNETARAGESCSVEEVDLPPMIKRKSGQ